MDATELANLLRRAAPRRQHLEDDPEQSAYRLFHGYGEGYPGIAIDRYGDSLLVIDKRGLDWRRSGLVEALIELGDFSVIGVRRQLAHARDPTALELEYLIGTEPAAPLTVWDNGLQFLVEPYHRQNPGLFLDARPVRRWLIENSNGRRVLNLFAFTGSLGLAARAGGATQVTHLDQKREPLKRAQENHALNRLPLDDRSFLSGNIYAHLPRAKRAGVQFDGIILDPPPQLPGKKRKSRPKGQDYAGLVPLVTPLLAPGGWLVCFFHRYDQCLDQYEEQVFGASAVPLEKQTLLTSGDDFPETNPEHKLRVVVFSRP